MTTDFYIHPSARDEYADIIRYYAAIDEDDKDEPLARAFDATFNRYLNRIIDHPLQASLRRPPTRRVNLTPRFGEYYIAYMIWREKVVILAIAHAKRRPCYWRKRIAEAKKLF